MNHTLEASQLVNQIGKYLYMHLDGAFKIDRTANMIDVYVKMLYEVPYLQKIPGKQQEGYNDLHEIVIDLNITTYQNKVRVNIIEVTPQARTLGYNLYEPEKVKNLEYARQMIWKRVIYQISKAYKGYEFVF